MADFAVDNAASLFIDQPLAEGLGSRTAAATPEQAYTYAELAALVDRAAPEAVGTDAMAFWLYTSGTTGTPKAVVHCHRTLLNCHHYGHDVLAIGPHDRVFATSKLFFAYALGNALALPLFARGSCYLHPAWAEAPVVLQVLRDYRPTLFFSVPTVYARLLRAALPADAFRPTRPCVSAGARPPRPGA